MSHKPNFWHDDSSVGVETQQQQPSVEKAKSIPFEDDGEIDPEREREREIQKERERERSGERDGRQPYLSKVLASLLHLRDKGAVILGREIQRSVINSITLLGTAVARNERRVSSTGTYKRTTHTPHIKMCTAFFRSTRMYIQT